MARQFSLPIQSKWIECLAPATDAAGRTGAYASLKNAHKAYVVFHVTQGNAATIALSLLQATAVAGTSSKAGPSVPIWANQDLAASDTLVAQTAGNSFTTSAAVKHKMVMFEVDPSYLDVANGFDCITISTGASNAANITQAWIVLVPIRYEQATPPTAMTD